MAQKMSNSKKPCTTSRGRGSKLQTGNRGARRNPQDPQALVRMGKGQASAIKHVETGPYLGQASPQLFDPEQSRLNRALGYW